MIGPHGALLLMHALAPAAGAIAFACSRGPDGRLRLALALLGSLAAFYIGLTVAARSELGWHHAPLHAALFALAAAAGMAPRPHLDGMAGMLYAIIPAVAVAGPVAGAVIRLAMRLL